MLTALTSPLDKEASSLTPAQQQCPGLSAFINQLHHQNMVLKKQKQKFRIEELTENNIGV